MCDTIPILISFDIRLSDIAVQSFVIFGQDLDLPSKPRLVTLLCVLVKISCFGAEEASSTSIYYLKKETSFASIYYLEEEASSSSILLFGGEG